MKLCHCGGLPKEWGKKEGRRNERKNIIKKGRKEKRMDDRKKRGKKDRKKAEYK